jgi:hypothetical protein
MPIKNLFGGEVRGELKRRTHENSLIARIQSARDALFGEPDSPSSIPNGPLLWQSFAYG